MIVDREGFYQRADTPWEQNTRARASRALSAFAHPRCTQLGTHCYTPYHRYHRELFKRIWCDASARHGSMCWHHPRRDEMPANCGELDDRWEWPARGWSDAQGLALLHVPFPAFLAHSR